MRIVWAEVRDAKRPLPGISCTAPSFPADEFVSKLRPEAERDFLIWRRGEWTVRGVGAAAAPLAEVQFAQRLSSADTAPIVVVQTVRICTLPRTLLLRKSQAETNYSALSADRANTKVR